MLRRQFLLSTGIAGLLVACGGGESDQTTSSLIVLAWNNQAIDVVRRLVPGPPMVSRSLAMLHTAMYDAWTAYDPVALSSTTGSALRRPVSERTAENKSMAMSYAAYAILKDQYPAEQPYFDQLMTRLGYKLSTETAPESPAGIGNLAAQALLAQRHHDGANQLGDMTPSGIAFADYTAYASVNEALVVSESTPLAGIRAPARWQPLRFVNLNGQLQTQGYLGAHWGNVKPASLASSDQFRPTPPATLGSSEYVDQCSQMVEISAGLGEREKVIAEYWADGPRSETPPGHWCTMAQYVVSRDSMSEDDAVKLFFALTTAMFDASIATWESKRYYDYVRPITAIRYLFNGKMIKGFSPGGPAAGLQDIVGERWTPFQATTFPTPPFPEYTSGHSGYSASAAEVLRQFTGRDAFGASYTQTANSLAFDKKVPTQPVRLQWDTFTAAANEAGLSRLYGGIHFMQGNTSGLDLGRKVGAHAMNYARRLWSGQI